MKTSMKYLLATLVCAALLAVYAIGFAAPGFDVYNDDGIYLVAADSLAHGSGYKIISLPEPIADTKEPPMFPLALAAVWKIFPRFPQNIYALKIVPFGFAVAWLWLAFFYLRERSGEIEPAAWAVFLSVLSPWLLFSSVAFMTETMFAFFLTASFIVIDRASWSDRVAWPKVALAAALAAVAILTRTAGLPLILGGAGAFIARKKIRPAIGFASIVCALISPWFIWTSRHLPAKGSFEAYYSGYGYLHNLLVPSFTWSQKLDVIGVNIATSTISPGALMGVPASGLGLLLCLALFAFIVYGFVLDLRKGITSLNLFVLFYEGMMLLYGWPTVRFRGPVLPFLLYFAYIGASDALRRIPRIRSFGKVVAWSCAVLLFALASHATLRETEATLRSGSARFPFEAEKNWPETLSAMQWVSQNTSADAVFFGEEHAIYLLTGRRAIDVFVYDPWSDTPLGTPSQFVDGIMQAKVNYVIYQTDMVNPQTRFSREQIESAVSDHPAAFTAVRDAGVPNFVIYSVDRRELAAETKESGNDAADAEKAPE
jgi:hypothetical protein